MKRYTKTLAFTMWNKYLAIVLLLKHHFTLFGTVNFTSDLTFFYT